ncbi:1-propanol dehydrogenase PduQ [Kalamiella sp. sgz302252]|uniref:1-propanol dehydrogenase PduQ n=1 Tax=Pantoea sp. sgz302252 TaxID=3341827 RepID=UPI0036D4316B
MANIFSVPDIYYGENALASLGQLDLKRVAIVTDDFMLSSGKVNQLIAAMPQAAVAIYSGVRADPDTTVLQAGTEKFKAFQPDAIVALGGGSSLDAAKGIKVTLEEFNPAVHIRLIAIPTTSGSGSEVTAYAVISDTESGSKYPLISDALLPDITLLDARLVLSVPKSVTADTGMDVLTHAIEALVSTGANDFSDALAEKAVALTARYLPYAYSEPDNLCARTHMHHASCLAGIAFNSAGLGLVHGMAHAVGGMLHLPHGRINAMLLPLVIEFNSEQAAAQMRYRLCARLMDAEDLPQAVRALNRQFGIPATLKEMGTDLTKLAKLRPILIRMALADGCTATNPRQASVQDVDRLLTRLAGESGE